MHTKLHPSTDRARLRSLKPRSRFAERSQGLSAAAPPCRTTRSTCSSPSSASPCPSRHRRSSPPCQVSTIPVRASRFHMPLCSLDPESGRLFALETLQISMKAGSFSWAVTAQRFS
ncbi:hypothetical protein AOXY_G27476 [Acipenser oxyrinchus oxyrinchus]|uniref:Uncharacterized protein n=1 Tax=Acipenser oxyrinchus oxyrinchus TaxID=40147 RepID=A0AAD8CNT7_ACIOX|nr:hypothetical protein AOXY_G27476 [Acipenser oxyrinchus oxyrinchus]